MPGSDNGHAKMTAAEEVQDVAPELAGAGVPQFQLADHVVQVAHHQRVALLRVDINTCPRSMPWCACCTIV
jgi:hypothetical protein